MDFIEGGTAVLYAIILYALYYAVVGMQVYKALTADEEPLTRAFWFVCITFVSLMVWAIVGAVVYWGILIWFRIWLQQPHAWLQEILSDTGWFPFGLILKHGPIPVGGVRGAFILFGHPVVLLIAAGMVALWLRVSSVWETMAARRTHTETDRPVRAKETAR